MTFYAADVKKYNKGLTGKSIILLSTSTPAAKVVFYPKWNCRVFLKIRTWHAYCYDVKGKCINAAS